MVLISLTFHTRWGTPILIGDFDLGSEVPENRIFSALRRVGVEHEDLAEVGAGGLQQVQAVVWAWKASARGERLPAGVIAYLAEGDKAAPLLNLAVSARDRKALRVGEDRRIVFLARSPLPRHRQSLLPRGCRRR